MNNNIFLDDYSQYDRGEIRMFFKGSVTILEDIHGMSEEDWFLQTFVDGQKSESVYLDYLAEKLKKVSGLFSLVLKIGNSYIITGDMIRSYPVFYGFKDKNIFITNDLFKFQEEYGRFTLHNNNLEEFIASGFVYGNGTVYKDVLGLQAGEIIHIQEEKISSCRYFEFKHAEKLFAFENIYEFAKVLDKILISAFERTIAQTPDLNRWVVPLSGGHDSRMLCNYFYKLGLKNVICFSYGRAGSDQAAISREVAESLGFEWYFVEYTEQKWQELHNKGIIDDFALKTAFNGVSTPHLQDFLAVYELKEKNILRPGDVLVPGHTGDFLTGCNLGQADLACIDKVMAVTNVINKHSKIKDHKCYPVRTIEKIYDDAKVSPRYFQEYFNWQELRAKFTVNSLRTYEYFGFHTRLPYWDKEYVDFWLSVSDSQRAGRKILLEAESFGVLVPQLKVIPFYGKVDLYSRGNTLVRLMRKLLPAYIKTNILRFSKRKVKFNEGLNQIYAMKASTMKEILNPVDDFPDQTRPYFESFLSRYPYQIDYHFLSTLYTVRKLFDWKKEG